MSLRRRRRREETASKSFNGDKKEKRKEQRLNFILAKLCSFFLLVCLPLFFYQTFQSKGKSFPVLGMGKMEGGSCRKRDFHLVASFFLEKVKACFAPFLPFSIGRKPINSYANV